jgi:uncharacterized membrane protein YeaQ/YmgE (transglycosylase-associated protein family)
MRGPALFVKQTTGAHLSEVTSMIVNFVVWAVFGLLAGIAAKFVSGRAERTDPAGILLTIVLGILGALVGGFLSTRIFGWDVETFSIAGFVVAVAGALLLLFLYSIFQSARRTH